MVGSDGCPQSPGLPLYGPWVTWLLSVGLNSASFFYFLFFMTSWVIPRHLKKNMTSPACRSRGAVVRNNLRPAGGDAIVGACLSGRSCGFAVSGKRGRRLCGSASRLAECEQRKGTALWNVEVQVVFTCSVFPTVWWSSLELMYVWANNAQD